MTTPRTNLVTTTTSTRSSRRRARMPLGVGAALVACLASTGCIHRSGGTWMFRSAATPEGWPALTPIGVVEIREYPTYRAALVEQEELPEEGTRPLFMQLFRHIRENDIAMTAPVAMTYDVAPAQAPRMRSMAFLYRSQELGPTGEQGPVQVRDVRAQAFASVGVRGGYTPKNVRKGLDLLERWLAANADVWRTVGPPRFLGYNSPFVLPFLRYGEVQVPVERRGADDAPGS